MWDDGIWFILNWNIFHKHHKIQLNFPSENNKSFACLLNFSIAQTYTHDRAWFYFCWLLRVFTLLVLKYNINCWGFIWSVKRFPANVSACIKCYFSFSRHPQKAIQKHFHSRPKTLKNFFLSKCNFYFYTSQIFAQWKFSG